MNKTNTYRISHVPIHDITTRNSIKEAKYPSEKYQREGIKTKPTKKQDE